MICEQSLDLINLARAGELDLAIVTNCGEGAVEVIRHEPLLWVTSAQHAPEEQEVLPLALFKPPCLWRAAAIDALTETGRKFRVLYQSANSTAVGAAVSAGLAITALAESALRPGMRVLGESDGLPAPADVRDRHRPILAPPVVGRSSTRWPSTSSPPSTTCRCRLPPPEP